MAYKHTPFLVGNSLPLLPKGRSINIYIDIYIYICKRYNSARICQILQKALDIGGQWQPHNVDSNCGRVSRVSGNQAMIVLAAVMLN